MTSLEAGEIRRSDLDGVGSTERAQKLSASMLLGRLILLCIGLRIALEVIGLASLAYYDQPVWTNAINLWVRWDASNFLRLAEVGYVQSSTPPNADAFNIAYFPFFSLAVYIVSFVMPTLMLSGLLVSFAASVGAGYFLFRLVALDTDEKTAWRAVILLFSFPTAYFLSAPYTEALFLFAVLASVYAARTGRWAGAGAAGALATGTRITGTALAPALLVEAFASRAGVRERIRRLAYVAIAAAGLLIYLAINQIIHGDPLYFLEVQRTYFHNTMTPPWEPLKGSIETLLAGGTDFINTFMPAGRLAGVLLALPLLVVGIWRLRPADLLYGWTAFLFLLSSSFLISFPRYLIVVYPLFLVGARLGRSPFVFVPFVFAFAVLQGWLMWRYAVSQWTF